MFSADPYPPLNVPKPLADDIWIVDGPVVRMRYALGSTLPFSTRMTIVRLSGDRLWVHSPTELTDELTASVSKLGEVAFLVAPNRIHWMSLAAWQRAFPAAVTHAAPGVETNAKEGGFRIDAMLGGSAPDGWAGEIDQVVVPGDILTEVEFFHRGSRTLILTDLIENFEPDHLHGFLAHTLMGLGGVVDPHGSTPRDLRFVFKPKDQVRRAAKMMVDWAPERVILAHGRCYLENATEELKRALAWTGFDRT
ncbi:DUF4336 domain-containing protein [Amorphus orientalis]|uniref:DUF4336 domain-containing protein n=1 Tax=Amorphus orientalis TaxID=649198 RepID=A0AAE3VL04_9HYPH|nr:DUF4336 domain-containing protein [Amorphus orientalis]MDQ0313838.1 hypothetical protein [Amorphus orientalis]